MRIISGKMKGSSLFIPLNKNTRPLKDRARESIFNLLTHSTKISFELKKSIILDLYAGTGSFGLECISREAKSVCFVEKEKEAIKVLKKNIEKLRVEKLSNIYAIDVPNFIKKNVNQKFDLIFLDPPFKNNNIRNIIELLFINELLEKNGILILHRSKNTQDNIPKNFYKIDERIYGLSKIIFGTFLS